MYNYLKESSNLYGGFAVGYWTMSDDNKLYAWIVTGDGTLTGRNPQTTDYGALAVVEINK